MRHFRWPRHPAWHQFKQDNTVCSRSFFLSSRTNHMNMFLNDLVPYHNDLPLPVDCSCAFPVGYGP